MDIRRDNGKNSLDEIKRVQNELGFFFPNNYFDLIRNHDALRFEKNIFDFKNIYNNEDERDLNFLSFKADHLDGDILSNQDNVNDLENYGIKDLVVFGICANGDYICFDYREDSQTSNPKIVLVYHDDFVDFEDGTSSMVVNDVANNFEDFLNLLHE